MRAPFAVLLPFLAAACVTGSPCTTTAECGDFQACLGEVCRDVDCRSSADCALETFCSPETYTCEEGCASSDDCMVGDRCDIELGTCVPRQCTDTQLDCALGERCNAETRTCEKDPEPHCRKCQRNQQCGATGICAQLSSRGPGYCFLECSPESFDPCPAGLQCSAQVDRFGVPDGFLCVGRCDL